MGQRGDGAAPAWPWWERLTFGGLLVATAVALFWRFTDLGWGNEYYSAVVQSGASSLKAAFWTSPDMGAATASDKPPLSFWPMVASVRVFGLHGWSIALPQVLEGLGTVALTHLTVRRLAGSLAGVVAAAVCAVTPVFFVMSRFNDPDALLTLTTTVAAYATVRYAQDPAARRWLVVLGFAFGTGFLTKWLVAALPAPAFLYAVGRASWDRGGRPAALRSVGVVAGAAAVSGGWWLLAFLLTPSSVRPYPDSRSAGLLDLVLGQNGFSRLGVTNDARFSEINGLPGLARLVTGPFVGQVGWFLPLAAVGLVLAAVPAFRARRLPLGWVVFGGWLLLVGGVFSLMRGAMHPYYTTLLAPAVGGCVGLTLADLRRGGARSRVVAAGLVVLTGGYAVHALGPYPDLHLVKGAVVLGSLAAVFLLALGRGAWRPAAAAAAAIGLLSAPAAFALATTDHPVAGANPVAGPTEAEHGHGPYPTAVADFLRAHQDGGARWVAIVPTATAASALQLQSRLSVLVVGGFTGQAGFPQHGVVESWAASGQVRWLVLEGPYWSRDDPAGMKGTVTDAFVQDALRSHCRFVIPGTTTKVVDLTAPPGCRPPAG